MKELLRDAAYRRVWLVGACAGMMRWLDQLAVGIYVFEVTSSPLLVAIITLCRLMPMLAGAFIGALAERVPLRRMLIANLLAMTAVYGVLAALASLMAVPSLASATMAYTGTSKNPNGVGDMVWLKLDMAPRIVDVNYGRGGTVTRPALWHTPVDRRPPCSDECPTSGDVPSSGPSSACRGTTSRRRRTSPPPR